MHRTIRWLALLSGLVANVALAASPSQVQAEYKLELEGIEIAAIRETYTRNNDSYHIESITQAVGLAAMLKPETILGISDGKITQHGLRPLKLSQQRSKESERNTSAVFDWSARQLSLSDRYGTRPVTLPDDTQDRFSAMYQFMFLELHGKTALDFHMTNGSKVDIYNYLLTPDQHIEMPYGQFKALYIATPTQPNGAKTEIWLATEFSQIPVKIIIREGDGNRYTQTLTRLSITP